MAASTSYGAEQNGHASANEEQYISTFFCRALYDYKTSDASSLSFRKGDVIEVLTQLESGWWDGLLGDERGWFPSNYVAAISEQEAEAALSGSDFSVPQSSLPDDSMVDMVHSMSQSLSRSDNDADWLNGEAGYMSQVQHPHRQTNGTGGRPTQHNDFWVPQVSQDGRIFYVNTQTGQHARDLPQEPEEPEGDLAGLTALPASRTGSSAGYALGAVNGIDTTPTVAGFGIPRRSRTPEPWVKRLADDGMSYYYVNRLNGQISWTFPESSDPPAYVDDRPPQERPPVPEKSGLPSSVPLSNPSSYNSGTASASSRDTPTITTRLRSGSSTSTAPRDRSDSAVDRTSVYSDDSEVYPLGRDRAESSVGMRRTPRRYERAATPQEQTEVELTPSEQLARFLQQALAPSPPESPVELSNHVREAIAAVMAYLQSAALPRRPEQYKDVDERVLQVVSAVRNLLYVTATPSGHIPSNLYPRDVRDGKSLSSSQSLQVHLKAPQRKVAGTLSKLVLSSLAMQYDPGLSASDKPNRLETDVNELERAVIAFVVEVQQFQEQNIGKIGAKRLHGVFSTANVGLGLPGSGAASGWKGFGYVPLEEGTQPPMQILGSDLLSELKATVRSLGEKFNAVAVSLSRPGFDRERVRADGQHVVAQLSSLLEFIGNIHVSRHVDVDGVRFEAGQSSAQASYMQTIERSRQLLRSLEASTQALYDDGTLFFTAIQTIAGSDPRSEDSAGARHDIESCANTIRMNASFVTQTLDALLVIGYDQSDIGQGDYNSSIEWRSSRISMVNIPIDPAIARLSGEPSNGRPDSEIVDFELAFSRPSRPPAVTIAESSTLSSSATLYNSVSEPSQTSLDLSDRSRSGSVAEPVTPTWPQPDWAAAEPVDHQSLDTDLAETATIEDASSAFFDDEDQVASSSKSPPRPGAGAQKIFKLLGPDAPQHYIQKLNAEAKPWYLRPNYDQSEILMDPDGLVRAGTPAALVERLTAHEHGDPTFSQNFLMTFKSFMTVDELFDLLARRFWIEPPPTLTSSEMEEWRKLKQHVIRVRVLNTFKTMITDDGILEKEDMYILSRMKEFASDEVVISFAAAKQLLILIERAERSGDGPIKTVNAIPVAPPSSIVPKVGSKKVKLLDVDPLELARQLTLMEAALYKKIRPMECLQRSRESKPGRTSDNITSIIQLSNRIANWVAESVLGREDSRRRAAVVKHFINVADRCRMIQNYSTMTAIVSGLNTPPIRRLKRTWEQVSARFLSQLKSCESTIDTGKNFNNYRSILARISPPCVPFIGVYLTTLTFINDGAEDRLAGHMINFRKRQKAAEVIQDIKRWQSKPYNFNTVTSVLTYLEESFTKYTDGVDYGDQFWNLSLQREPREREDEKMARLLQESGFL